VYTHVKTKHPGEAYSARNSVRTNIPDVEQEKVNDLQRRLVKEEISGAEYEAHLLQIRSRYRVSKQETPPVSLDVGRVFERDLDYMKTYFAAHQDFNKLALLSSVGNAANTFIAIFRHQTQFSQDVSGWRITFKKDGNLITEDCNLDKVSKMYQNVVNGLALAFCEKCLVSSLEGYSQDSEEKEVALSESKEIYNPMFYKMLDGITGSQVVFLEKVLEPILKDLCDPIVIKNEDE
jgi:hypothetical protein